MTNGYLLELWNVSKFFPGVIANNNVNLTLKKEKYWRYWVKMAQASQHW